MRASSKLPRRFDGRTNDARRVKHLIQEYTSVLGGVGRLNIGESNTIHRLAALIVLCERQESQMISFDPKYNPDEHMRNVGKIKLLQDDLDLPKRSRSHSGNGGAPEYEEIPGETLEEYLARPEVIKSAERAIPTARIGAPKRKRLRL